MRIYLIKAFLQSSFPLGSMEHEVRMETSPLRPSALYRGERVKCFIILIISIITLFGPVYSMENHRSVNDQLDTFSQHLLNAARNNSIITAQIMINHGASINVKNERAQTPLHLAAACGNIVIVERLLKESTININAQTELGNTPLHLVIDNAHSDIEKLSLEEHIDVKPVNNNHLETLQLLLGMSKINISLPNKDNKTPLYFALAHHNTSIVKQLLCHKSPGALSQENFETMHTLKKDKKNYFQLLHTDILNSPYAGA